MFVGLQDLTLGFPRRTEGAPNRQPRMNGYAGWTDLQWDTLRICAEWDEPRSVERSYTSYKPIESDLFHQIIAKTGDFHNSAAKWL